MRTELRTTAHNPFPSNFLCNPSRIDGLGITDSSQGGGGIYVHAWGHYLEISNNRVFNNAGTLSGGINVGQGEFPPAYLAGAANAALNAAPGSCESARSVTGLVLPYCHDIHVNVHHNAIVANSSTGDELFSATPAGAGGVSFCTGSDYYKFNYNWVCGNQSSGDGGGFGHVGFIKHGDIEHNSFLFNQSTNPTIPTNGGAIVIMGAPDVDPPCATNDQDCISPPGTVGPSDGTGPGLVINANLIMGNAADSGSGGGLRLQNVNGTDVVTFPTVDLRRRNTVVSCERNPTIITNNVAGWDGAGISMVDALDVNIVNNTDRFERHDRVCGRSVQHPGRAAGSSTGPCPEPTTRLPGYPASPVRRRNPPAWSASRTARTLIANLPATVTCPAGHFTQPPAQRTATAARSLCLSSSTTSSGKTGPTTSVWAVSALEAPASRTWCRSSSATARRLRHLNRRPLATAANGAGVLITGGTGACAHGFS